MTHTSTLDPDPRSLKIPDRIARDTSAIASSRCSARIISIKAIRFTAQGEERTHRQILLVSAFKDGHGSHTSTPHRHVRQLVCRPMRMHGEEVSARIVDAADNEIGADVALVPDGAV